MLHALKLPIHPNSLALDKQTGAAFVAINEPHAKGAQQGESVACIDLPEP
ncbi:hypothetical protein [Alcaligenes sp. SDU_A2]